MCPLQLQVAVQEWIKSRLRQCALGVSYLDCSAAVQIYEEPCVLQEDALSDFMDRYPGHPTYQTGGAYQAGGAGLLNNFSTEVALPYGQDLSAPYLASAGRARRQNNHAAIDRHNPMEQSMTGTLCASLVLTPAGSCWLLSAGPLKTRGVLCMAASTCHKWVSASKGVNSCQASTSKPLRYST